MLINYKKLGLVNFPIFALPSDDIHGCDGLVRFGNNPIIDDLNQIGKTLGARRLQTPHKTYKLNRVIYDIPELLKAPNAKAWIDNKGYIFIYERTKFVRVKCHKILAVNYKGTGSTLKIQGAVAPVLLKRPPPKGMPWVLMMHLNNNPWLPYEYSREYCTPFRRKI
jgi:hypothetical protein